jgi:tRNA (cmo5U34)-methyltransferase
MTSKHDQLFLDPGRQLVDFAFDDAVANVFPDMIRRSVPGYETVVPLTGLMAVRHLRGLPPPARTCYDLGCSLGATTLAVLHQLGDLEARLIGVDNAPAMIERARVQIIDPRVRFELGDMRELPLQPAGVVILNYVLQFIPPTDRLQLLAGIRAALDERGLLIVSGKIRFSDPIEEAFYDEAHLDFKRANGYQELEISGKRSALERVMILDTEEDLRASFAAAGFRRVRKWYQCLNWASLLVSP